jgi:hypothetical protein
LAYLRKWCRNPVGPISTEWLLLEGKHEEAEEEEAKAADAFIARTAQATGKNIVVARDGAAEHSTTVLAKRKTARPTLGGVAYTTEAP